jgi:hypothetical protein
MSPRHTPHDITLRVVPWEDPIVESRGFAVNDPYIEMFWLPVLGPTATWLYRRLVSGVLHSPSGYTINMDELARTIGVAYTQGRHNPFVRALQRCVMFGVAEHIAVQPVRTLAITIGCRTYAKAHTHHLASHSLGFYASHTKGRSHICCAGCCARVTVSFACTR